VSDSNPIDNLSPVKRALLEIKELKARLSQAEKAGKEPIAIIGAGLRFPGDVSDLESYWQLLINGMNAISDIPKDRWNIDTFYDPDPEAPGKMYTRKGGFLKQIDQFDPHFFGIAPREAVSMDPQQRLVLQVGWEALENAGQAPDKLDGSLTGVFIGISNNDYSRLLFEEYRDIDLHYATGNAFSVVPGRFSYLLGLQGPSMAIDTACSSSLVAVHLACQSLRTGESDLALAGGVNLILTPEMNINFCKAKMMAFDDKCKTFDAAADGYVRGEGCAIIVLKRLSDALANQDNILAVILGSAVNQDGRSSGLTAPNGPSQEAVIRQALLNAGVEPGQVSYVEAHGTGTSLGDPIEVQALAAALEKGRSSEDPVMIGSVKTNFGHLEAAAGIAGLLKLVLALRHQEIPPHLHLQKLNPYIPWQRIAVTVPTERTAWRQRSANRIGGVSSFGFSGTNAHVILSEAPEAGSSVTAQEIQRPVEILTVSAKRQEALMEMVARFNVQRAEDVNFRDFCFSANTGRAHLNHRLAVISKSAPQAQQKLTAFRAGEDAAGVVHGKAPNNGELEITFLFTGHGAQYVHMGRQLFETHPGFRTDVETCNQLLKRYLEEPLLSVLYPSSPEEEAHASELMETMTYAQPALFAIEYALAKLWRSWGLEPTFVMGHSVGEYAAACLAGVFSLEDGLKLVCARGRLMDSLPQTGKMVTVFAEREKVEAMIAPYAKEVAIAAVNGKTHVVISGSSAAVDAITAKLEAEGIKIRHLEIAQAAHSPMLDPILDEFERIASEIRFASPQTAIVSSMTGQIAAAEEITNPRYWRRHLREPVQFALGMETLKREQQKVLIEIGPQPTLLGMGRRALPEWEENALWLPSLRKGQEDWQEILESLGRLYVNGAEINWDEFERPYGGHRIPLPNYPWAKESYWTVSNKKPQLEILEASLWETMISAGRKQSQQAPLDFSLQSFTAKWDILDQLTKAYIVDALGSWKIFTKSNEAHTVEGVLELANILPGYNGLIARWLNHLTNTGLLVRDGSYYTSLRPLPQVDLSPLLEQADRILADSAPLLDYIKRCAEKITPVLTGKENPLETLFPEGAYTTVDYLYHDWPLIQYFNGIMREVVGAIFNTMPAGKKLRILEIGAGTGGSTAALVPHLPVGKVEYQFTDLSDFFLTRAEERFRAYPFMQYGTLDIEKDPETQGYAPQSADVIIAANALHATRDLNITLANVKKLLAPGGFLILLEGTRYLSWLDATTSFIEGWGRFEDEYRTETPLLSADKWRDIILKNGFAQVTAFPEDQNLSALLVHNIILAQTEATELSLEEARTPQTRSEISTAHGGAAGLPIKPMQKMMDALPADRREILVNYVRDQVARILRLAPSFPLSQTDRLMDLGLDSLMAVELRSRIGKGLELDRPLSATLVFDHPTIQAIAEYLDNELFGKAESAAAMQSGSSPIDTASTEGNIAELSDEEVEKLLMKKLGDMG
jgi:acyl transferase domain-containing protein/SAM-dependent methyltransferase